MSRKQECGANWAQQAAHGIDPEGLSLLPKNSRARIREAIRCEVCGISFYPKRPWQRFCGLSCKRAAETRNPPTHWGAGQVVRVGDALPCPKCHSRSSRVANCRGQVGFVWRRRECRKCGASFETVEKAVTGKR